MKLCRRCDTNKPTSEFNKNRHKPDGLTCWCRDCNRKYAASISPDKRKEWTENRRIKYVANPAKYLLAQARYRAAKAGVECNITEADIECVSHCPILGYELVYLNRHSLIDASASLDRVDVNLGYVKGNVRVISYRANRLKGDGTIDEHKRIIEYMRQYGKAVNTTITRL